MTLNYLGLRYEIEKKIMPWIHRESKEFSPFIPDRVRRWGKKSVEVPELGVTQDKNIITPPLNLFWLQMTTVNHVETEFR